MKIVIIPARVGSKRIKEKNIKNFLGVAIIERVIQSLIKMRLFDKIIISTDSLKVIKKINKFKKDPKIFPYLRPKRLGGDLVSTRDVIIDAIQSTKIKKNDYVFCIYPTSIFLRKENLLESLRKIKNKKLSYVFSAKEIDRNVYRSFTFIKSSLSMIFRKNYKKRTQDLKKLYCDAAQFYLAKAENWIKEKIIFSSKSDIVVLDKYSSIDLDEIEDWLFAEKIYKMKKNK